MNFETFGYFKKFVQFDTNRRERSGISMVSPADLVSSYHQMWNCTDAYVQHFNHIDLTGHTNNDTALEITLFTYSNGVTVKGRFFLYEDDLLSFKVDSSVNFYDIHDNLISSQTNWGINHWVTTLTKTQQDYNDFNMMYAPPAFNWDQADDITVGTPATSFSPSGMLIYNQGNPGYPPSNAPALTGLIDYTKINQFYNYARSIMTSEEDLNNWKNTIDNGGDGTIITPLLPSEDTSEPGGGDHADPDYNPFSDPVDFPGLPSGGSAIASGFIRVYNPTSGQLQALASKLWGNDFINTIHKIMNDPMEAMISLHSVPFQIVGGSNANIEVGNFDTEVSAKTVTTQYYTLNCGNISLPEHWASALDYSPYTTVDIFIPFVGVRPLQIDDVMGRVLNLKYNIDVLTGCAIAMLKCGDSVLYTYNTQVHTEIPYTMSSYGRLVQSIIGVAGTAIGATAGGAGALIGASIGGALGTAMAKHSDISRGGSLGGAVGVMGDFTPYLIIHRPIQSLASDFANKRGYPSNISATLSSVSGYTVVDKIHLTGIDCTDTERDEIHALLKEGVII